MMREGRKRVLRVCAVGLALFLLVHPFLSAPSSENPSSEASVPPEVELSEVWRRRIDEAVDSLWRQRYAHHHHHQHDGAGDVAKKAIRLRRPNGTEDEGRQVLIQFIDGQIYSRQLTSKSMPSWEGQRLENLKRLISMAHEQGGNFPNFELIATAADCTCSFTHCFSVVACAPHRERPYLSLPYVQWFNDRDGPLLEANKRARSHAKYGSEAPWEQRASVAVFRGVMNHMTTIDGLPGDPFLLRFNLSNWHQYGRGRLLTLRTQERLHPSPRLNVNLDSGTSWRFGIKDWNQAIQDMMMDEPGHLSMQEQVQGFKYSIYAEGSCGWADRLKWQLALGLVPILQETRCKEWYARMLTPWEHYIPVDGHFNNLTAAVDWARENDELVRRMALADMDFAVNVISRAGMVYYTQRLLRSYIDHLHPDHRPSTHDPQATLWKR